MKYCLVSIFFLFFTNNAFALDITLDGAIKEALKNNHNIIIAKTKAKKAKCELSEARKIFSPGISINVGRNLLSDKETLGVSVSQDLDRLLGLNFNQKEKARLDVEIADNELFIIEQEIIKQAASAYYEVTAQEDLVKLKECILNLRKKDLEIITSKFDAGKGSLETLLSSQKEIAQVSYELEKSKKDLKRLELSFYQLLGRQGISKESVQ